MTDSEHGRERTVTQRKRRTVGHYCAYCGRNCTLGDQPATDDHAGVRARAFCDTDCEHAWNIDASDTLVHT